MGSIGGWELWFASPSQASRFVLAQPPSELARPGLPGLLLSAKWVVCSTSFQQ